VRSDLLISLQTALGGSYVIERELSGGGMSRVFLATEAALGRRVVIKVLTPELSGDMSIERFEREIRIAARLSHPNIVPMLAAGERDGLPFYTMPYVEGDSLRVRLAHDGALPVDEAHAILRDVARALAYAHAHGVVHRDIKPENVLLTGGVAVVTDFGISKAIADAKSVSDNAPLTRLGAAIGTPAYMSPEQASGDPRVDHRADIYAWGLVAFETLTGEHPFSRHEHAQDVMMAHLTELPPLLQDVRPEVDAMTAELVMRALEKNPADRPPDAAEIVATLDRATRLAYGTPPYQNPAVLPRGLSPTPRDTPAIAVLPFANLSADPENEYFSDGITDEIMSALARGGAIRVTGRGSSFALKGKPAELQALARQLRVRGVLEGSVRKAGKRVRITAQLTSADDGFLIWSDRYDRELTDIFTVQEEIASDIARALRDALQLTPRPGVEPGAARAEARDPEANDAYLRGRHLLDRQVNGVGLALPLLERAVAIDPEFAAAHTAIARANVQLLAFQMESPRTAGPRAEAAAQRALALDERHAEAHAAYGAMCAWYDWDWPAAEPHFNRAIELDPGLPVLRVYRGWSLAMIGRAAEAAQDAESAVGLDPHSVTAHHTAGLLFLFADRFDRAMEIGKRAVELDDLSVAAHMAYGVPLLHAGRTAEAIAMLERARALSGGKAMGAVGFLGLAYHNAGRDEDARRVLADLRSRAASAWAPALPLSVLAWSLGEHGAALEHLRVAIDERDFLLALAPYIQVFRPYWTDPAVAALAANTGPRG
jgi:serine/threonine-protein kinase